VGSIQKRDGQIMMGRRTSGARTEREERERDKQETTGESTFLCSIDCTVRVQPASQAIERNLVTLAMSNRFLPTTNIRWT
jgi:hypothetical protein